MGVAVEVDEEVGAEVDAWDSANFFFLSLSEL